MNKSVRNTGRLQTGETKQASKNSRHQKPRPKQNTGSGLAASEEKRESWVFVCAAVKAAAAGYGLLYAHWQSVGNALIYTRVAMRIEL